MALQLLYRVLAFSTNSFHLLLSWASSVTPYYFYWNYRMFLMTVYKAPYTLSVKLNDFTVWHHTWWKNWVNYAVLTGNSKGLITVLSNHLSHTKLHSSPRESGSSLSFPAHTTMASSQGTSVSSTSFSRWTSHDIFLFEYHFLLHILRFLFFFSDNIMADVGSKQQTTALFLSTLVTPTRRHTELIKKTNKPGGKLVLCQGTFSSVFFTQLSCTV